MPPRKKKVQEEEDIAPLTDEEKKIAKTSTFFAHKGRAEWGWRGKGLSSEAKVAQSRGVVFKEFSGKDPPDRLNFYPDNLPAAIKALKEVATWLGYSDWISYNKACETKEKEVRQRLRAAK